MGTSGILLEGGAMVPRILYLHPKTYKHLIRLRKQAERDGAYRVAKRLQAVVLNSEGRTSGAGPSTRISTLEGLGVVSTLPNFWRGRTARRASFRPAIRADIGTTETARRHSRKRPGSLRPGYGHLDLSHDRLGHRGGIRHSLSSRPCAQVAPSFGLLGAASASRAGPSQRGPARSLAALHLSQS